MKHKNFTAGQQRPVDLEGGVLRGGADEDDAAVLHKGEEGVLLGLVEAVDLVHEHNGPLAKAAVVRRLLHHRPDLLDAAGDSGEVHKGGPGVVAITRARVVFPTPGGPQKIMEEIWSPSMRRRRTFPGPSRWDWPTTSSSVSGAAAPPEAPRPADQKTSAAP